MLEGGIKMKQYILRSGSRIITLIIVTIIIFSSFSTTYAAPIVPQNIKVGLSFNNAANNNFILKSDYGIKLSSKTSAGYAEILTFPAATGFKVRKDAYYNIVNNKETEINYTKAGLYNGELEGPYHIQIGDVYPDLNSAKVVADSMISLSQTVFVAYENGWRVWSQLYLEESECLTQIQIFKNEMPNYTYTVVAPNKSRIQLFDTVTGKLMYIINAEQEIKLEPVAKDNITPVISFGTLKYRGVLFLKRVAAGHINIYNELLFEQYLYGVVPAEMPNSWHIEALKAQAVAARNYGIINIGRHTADGFDVCNGTHCQAYRGFGHENPRTNQATDETKGKLVLYNDKVIPTYFHSSSGGRTENSENVWSTVLPYMKGVDDKYGLGSPYDNWTKQYNKKDIQTKLLANSIDVGEINDIVPLTISENGRVTCLEVRGTKGNAKLDKEKIRTILGSSDIKSTWYKITTDADMSVINSVTGKSETARPGSLYVMSANGVSKLSTTNNKVYLKDQVALSSMSVIPQTYLFAGKGWGHGLGMSQYGAKGMAEAGFNFIQILEHYYTGTKVN
ncbi:MAG: SpoIID/LytB protein [Clostridia bacterium]|nr:SpoIID/LytB protein [Clostridia bacterium]